MLECICVPRTRTLKSAAPRETMSIASHSRDDAARLAEHRGVSVELTRSPRATRRRSASRPPRRRSGRAITGRPARAAACSAAAANTIAATAPFMSPEPTP